MSTWKPAQHPRFPGHAPGGKGGEFAPKAETHTELVARMLRVKPNLAVGSRVRVSSGWTGEVVAQGHPHVGWKIRWDNPQFGQTEGWVRTANILEATPKAWHDELPSGYTLRDRRPLAASTKKRWNREWGFMLRDLWTKGGHGWQHWGGGHTSSGIQTALADRGMIDKAESPKGPLLFRITPDGLGRLEDWWTDFNRGAEFPDPPAGAPVDYTKILTPGEQKRLDEHRANLAAQAAQRDATAAQQAARLTAEAALRQSERDQLEDELKAIDAAAAHRAKLLATDDAPFVDMKLAEWQARRATEIKERLVQLA